MLILLIGWVSLGNIQGQNPGAFSVSSFEKEYFPEDSVQLYRTTYRILISGSGRIKEIKSIRVEDWTLQFDKLEKRIKIVEGKPLQVVVNCMENRRAKRTEWMLTSWYGPNESASNLYVIQSDRMKNGHAGLPDLEIICTTKKGEVKLTGDLPEPAAQSPK